MYITYIIYIYIYIYILNLKKSNMRKAHNFANGFRSIDDLCVNDNRLFEKHKKNYPEEHLELKKENVSSTKALD